MAEQNLKNHTRLDPAFHFFILPVLLFNIPIVGYWYYRHYIYYRHIGAWMIVVSLALLVLAFTVRIYSLKVQDRVIRIEEKHRIAALVSASELVELESLTIRQYVALRFASNVELPALARRAVRENLTSKQIKESIVSWRADEERV